MLSGSFSRKRSFKMTRTMAFGQTRRSAPTLWGNISNRRIQEIPRRKLRRDDTVRAAFDSGRHTGLPLQYAKNETINAEKP